MHDTEEGYINKRAYKTQNTLISLAHDSRYPFPKKKGKKRIIFDVTGTM